jgi:general secretion pathway protein L
MATLIVYLPAANAAATQELDFVVRGDDGQPARQGRASIDLLPALERGDRVVAVVPASVVSWHTLTLPASVASALTSARADVARSRAVLSGALEEHLLSEPQSLHFAVFDETRDGQDLWVAVCDRQWLGLRLQSLEAAGLAVTSVVPEIAPTRSGEPDRWVVTAGAASATLLLSTTLGVMQLPVGPAAAALARSGVPGELLAEPAVLELAEQQFGQRARAFSLTERLLAAADSGWDLAQLDFRQSHRSRTVKRFGAAWGTFWRTPAWRPVRWGLIALLLCNLVVVNALAWRQQALLEDRRTAINAVLTRTFPQVTVIVDAPLQMQREVSALAQSRGAGNADLAQLLTAVSGSNLQGVALTGIDLTASGLRLRASGLVPANAQALSSALSAKGWLVRLEGDSILIQPGASL